MRAVNLLPPDVARTSRFGAVRGRPRAAAPTLVGLVGGVLVAAVLAAAFVLTSRTEESKRDELAQRQAELALLPLPDKEPASEAAPLAAEAAPRVAAVSTALSTRVPWDRILDRLSLVLPENVWLRSLDLRAPSQTGAATGQGAAKGLSIAGYTSSHDAVARLLSRLALVPELTNVQLETSTMSELADRPVVEFTILADVRPAVLSS
jgi:Tfp pilus assembly protein PilN